MGRGVGLHMTERGLWRPDAMIVWKWGGGQGERVVCGGGRRVD